ncbi:hypothetical protein GH714_032529 [Hevea brasiliensis]|uniref:Uncharacterized protein n=1 Tax=Hevea brasiliensis TaxID=3981 RepID=A0A6A6N9V9_HEVBR|nr:hypothetical protein GH714_032529 [Hevea brasiliensis]
MTASKFSIEEEDGLNEKGDQRGVVLISRGLELSSSTRGSSSCASSGGALTTCSGCLLSSRPRSISSILEDDRQQFSLTIEDKEDIGDISAHYKRLIGTRGVASNDEEKEEDCTTAIDGGGLRVLAIRYASVF